MISSALMGIYKGKTGRVRVARWRRKATGQSAGGGDSMAAEDGGGVSVSSYRSPSQHHGRLPRASSSLQRRQGGRQ